MPKNCMGMGGVTMEFKAFQLIIGGQIPTTNEILSIAAHGQSTYRSATELYLIERSMEDDNRFLWISCRYDNAELYSDEVYDEESEQLQKNPRRKSQVEPRKQLFICYDIAQAVLYLSDPAKKAFVKGYFHLTLQKTVEIKNIYSSIDDFEATVRFLKSARFAQRRCTYNLTEDSIFNRVSNIYGFDIPDKIKLKIDWTQIPIENARGFIRRMKNMYDSGACDDIIFIGLDDNQVEQSFNLSTIIKSININVTKDENQHYDSDEVKNSLLHEIR